MTTELDLIAQLLRGRRSYEYRGRALVKPTCITLLDVPGALTDLLSQLDVDPGPYQLTLRLEPIVVVAESREKAVEAVFGLQAGVVATDR